MKAALCWKTRSSELGTAGSGSAGSDSSSAMNALKSNASATSAISEGRIWSAVPQGRHFTQLGASVDFANARDGVVWIEAGDAQGATPPPLYATPDSGRTWTSFVPELTG